MGLILALVEKPRGLTRVTSAVAARSLPDYEWMAEQARRWERTDGLRSPPDRCIEAEFEEARGAFARGQEPRETWRRKVIAAVRANRITWQDYQRLLRERARRGFPVS